MDAVLFAVVATSPFGWPPCSSLRSPWPFPARSGGSAARTGYKGRDCWSLTAGELWTFAPKIANPKRHWAASTSSPPSSDLGPTTARRAARGIRWDNRLPKARSTRPLCGGDARLRPGARSSPPPVRSSSGDPRDHDVTPCSETFPAAPPAAQPPARSPQRPRSLQGLCRTLSSIYLGSPYQDGSRGGAARPLEYARSSDAHAISCTPTEVAPSSAPSIPETAGTAPQTREGPWRPPAPPTRLCPRPPPDDDDQPAKADTRPEATRGSRIRPSSPARYEYQGPKVTCLPCHHSYEKAPGTKAGSRHAAGAGQRQRRAPFERGPARPVVKTLGQQNAGTSPFCL
ncbi:hypothetical protein SALB_05327 [Streptomyces noursei]|uniref:Uncharacterized protein n=1 Tax=Streptomyces noursei TaxID=1971 RepID=A0A401R4L8_STRNR|nr:hypothetical protein SALB_05327 [Streptomyces noursei]